MKKLKIIIYICIFFIVCNLIVKLLIVDNQTKQIFFLQKRVMAMRSDSSSALEKSKLQRSKQHKEINLIMNQIPKVLSFSEYAVKIRSLIDDNQLTINSGLVFSPGKAQNPSLLIYDTKFVVTGKYPDIKQFIAAIQNLKGIKHLNSINMTRNTNDNTKISLGIKLSIFLKKEIV